MNQAGRAEVAQDGGGLACLLGRVGGDAGVERAPRTHGVIERHHRFFERRVGIGAVAVEDVHVLQPHALEALVEAGDQILARPPLAIRPGPHVVARFGRDDQLVAIRTQVLRHHAPEVLLGGAGRRSVVVGEVEVCDAEVEGAQHHGAPVLVGIDAAEVVPQPQRHRRQQQPAAPRAAIEHAAIIPF